MSLYAFYFNLEPFIYYWLPKYPVTKIDYLSVLALNFPPSQKSVHLKT